MGKEAKDPIDIEIGGRIRNFRENILHDTRENFAAQTTLSLQFVYDIEAGNKGLSAKSIRKIVETYRSSHGLTADYLILGEFDKDPKVLSPIELRKVETHLEGALNILKDKENTDL